MTTQFLEEPSLWKQHIFEGLLSPMLLARWTTVAGDQIGLDLVTALQASSEAISKSSSKT